MRTSDPRRAYDLATFKVDNREYYEAAKLLRELVDAEPSNLELRLLLARAYFHSAQTVRAEGELRVLVDRDPTDAYAPDADGFIRHS